MRGFITERDFDEAEDAFPGIARFYASLPNKPRTFLELTWLYAAAEKRGSTRTSPCEAPLTGLAA